MVGFAPEHNLDEGQGHDVNSSSNSAAREHHVHNGSSGRWGDRESGPHHRSNPASWFRGIPHLHWYDTSLPDNYYDLCSPKEPNLKAAEYWKTRAGEAESRKSPDNYADAVELLEEGIRQGAEPKEELESALEDVRIRWRSTERIRLREAEHFGHHHPRRQSSIMTPISMLTGGTVSRNRCVQQWIHDHNPTTTVKRTLDDQKSDVLHSGLLSLEPQSIAAYPDKHLVTKEHSDNVTLDNGIGGDIASTCNRRGCGEDIDVNQDSINTNRGPGRVSDAGSFGFDLNTRPCKQVGSVDCHSNACAEGQLKILQQAKGMGSQGECPAGDQLMEDGHKSSGDDCVNGDASVICKTESLPMSDAEKGRFLDQTKDILAIVLARLLEASLVPPETNRDCAQTRNCVDSSLLGGCHSETNPKSPAAVRTEAAADDDNVFCSPMSVDEDDNQSGVIKNLFMAGRPARLALSFDTLSLSKGGSSTDSGIFDHMPTTTCWGENDRGFIGGGSPLDRGNSVTKTHRTSDMLASPVLKPGPFPGCGPVFGALMAEDKVSSAPPNPGNGKLSRGYGFDAYLSPYSAARAKRMSAPATMGPDGVCVQAGGQSKIMLDILAEEECETAPPVQRYGHMDSRDRRYMCNEASRRSTGRLPNQEWDIVGSLGLYPPSSQPYSIRSQDWYCGSRRQSEFDSECSIQNGAPGSMVARTKAYPQPQPPLPCASDAPYAARPEFLPGQPRPPMYRGCSNGGPSPSANATTPAPSYGPPGTASGSSDWVQHHRGVVRWFDNEPGGGTHHRSRSHGRGGANGRTSAGDSRRRDAGVSWNGSQGNGGGWGRRSRSSRGGRGGPGRFANYGRIRWEHQRPAQAYAAAERPSQSHHQEWQAWE